MYIHKYIIYTYIHVPGKYLWLILQPLQTVTNVN